MDDFLYGGSVMGNDSSVSNQSLLDTLSINNLLNMKHLTNGASSGGNGCDGLSPSVSEPSMSASPNSSSLMLDSMVDNNNGGSSLSAKNCIMPETSSAGGNSAIDESGLLITSSNTSASVPTITTPIASECQLTSPSNVNTLSLQLTAPQSDDDTSTSSLLNGGGSVASPIASLNSHNATHHSNNPNSANNNLLIENSDLHLTSAAEELSLKAGDLSCLNVTSSLMNGGSSSQMGLPPNGLNFGSTSDHSPWSSSIDDSPGSHLSINELGGFQSYSSNQLYNGAAVAAAAAAAAAQQQRRAITASHGGFSHHELSPNSAVAHTSGPNHMLQHSSVQSQQQQNQFKDNYPTWTNPAPAGSWSQQQQQHQQQQQQQQQQQHPAHLQQQNSMNSWNRGRSVPNMNLGNSLTSSLQSRKAHNSNPQSQVLSPYGNHMHQQQQQQHHQHHQQQQQQQQQSHLQQSLSVASNLINSPSKYRRSTSYPGKSILPNSSVGGGFGGGPLDTIPLDDSRDSFLSSYQDRTGLNNGLDMRSLEHCLSDIMRNVGEASQPDHLKGFLNCNTNALQSLAQLHGKPFFSGLDEQISDDVGGFGGNLNNHHHHQHHHHHQLGSLGSPARSSPHSNGSESTERFSRKVFVGGLPPDIDEEEITTSFNQYGALVVDWPHKAESKSYFPPKGYAFLLFQEERGVQKLIETCHPEDDKLYITVSSPTIKNKAVQIRPWRLADADYVLDASMPLDARKTVFVGGVPRPLKAYELATIMDRLYGGVCYAGIDTDPELKYPKGAGRVAFSNQQSYIAAISARFVQLQHGDIDKRVEVKPYVLDDQMCDECQGQRCGGKFAPFFCANVTCLQYFCEHCWAHIHSRSGREYHKPLVKEGADRPRAVPFRWC
ncbi:cytoplasmic polyadenylation element-binding protein 2 isoform X2 [Toxorhynchites rutilus septentrionalis]|uniref:cytoplasmic polyadenylation element-binding protein 2 isoform X2 n=1 Tax=Toxorhynchites rutilus septentrionalis TaxID=329112 RepID=UPI0024795AB6|nr:cytoplasmic polyadenylation element-binding protein 2 isoform X2 [Toxorhynchites rutilus septentrionalis]